MDLFGDLPEPSKQTATNDEKGSGDDHQSTEQIGKKRKIDEDNVTNNDNVIENNPRKKLSSDVHTLQGYHAECKGEREEMQDAFVICDDFLPQVECTDPALYRLAYYGVFDGHAGARASTYAAQYLHKNLASKFPRGDLTTIESEIKKCTIEALKKTDEDFLKLAAKTKPAWKDGTTAVTVLAINNTLYISNLGDSKAVLCRYNDSNSQYVAIPLTKDHNPAQYEERIRIQKAGGNVRDGRVMGVLEVSRSVGDGRYKNHGVTCLPDIKKCQLTPSDRYVIIACDGLWKAFSPDAVIEFTNTVLEDKSIEGTELRSVTKVRWETACVRLVAEAVRRLSADNVTVLLISIGDDR